MSNMMTMQASLVETTIGTAETAYAAMPSPNEWKLSAVYFAPAASEAIHAAHYATLTIKQGATSLGSLATNVTALTAGTAEAVAMTAGTGSSREFGAGDSVTMAVTKTGNGIAMLGVVSLAFEKIVS